VLELGLFLLMPAPAAAQSRSGTVVSIGDGDTLRIRQGQRTISVRLTSIDAPEMAQLPHGQRAREVLRMR